VVNVSDRPIESPVAGTVVLASGPLDDGRLPPDTAVWLMLG
jgi:alpha-glucosidase